MIFCIMYVLGSFAFIFKKNDISFGEIFNLLH